MRIGQSGNRAETKSGGLQLRTRLIASIVLLATHFVCSSLILAQAVEQSGMARSPLSRSTPDFSGVWMAEGEGASRAFVTAAGERPAMTAWGESQYKNAGAVQKISPEGKSHIDPYSKCDPPGVPRVYLFDGPLEIIETANRVFIFYEEGHYWREIWMDGRGHPQNPDPTYMGYSVGRWADETLVVDTIGFNDKTWLDNAGHPHSDALHVVERFKRVDNDTLEITFLFDDPKAYDKPWTAAPRILKSKPGRELLESFCVQDHGSSLENKAMPLNAPKK
jgi:hypothetical protein